MNAEQREKYLHCIRKMLSVFPGYQSMTLRNYLALLEDKFGDKFNPLVALDDIIDSATTLRITIEKEMK